MKKPLSEPEFKAICKQFRKDFLNDIGLSEKSISETDYDDLDDVQKAFLKRENIDLKPK
jgi:hypothetical protein